MASLTLLGLIFPVADRASELLYTLAGILWRNPLADVEIVVSHNRPDPTTTLRWLALGICVSVVRPSQTLHVTANFEFAASHASGIG